MVMNLTSLPEVALIYRISLASTYDSYYQHFINSPSPKQCCKYVAIVKKTSIKRDEKKKSQR